MAKLTLENLLNILERKGSITKSDIKEELGYQHQIKESLMLKNILKDEATAVKIFLKDVVLPDNAPHSYAGAMHYHHVISPLYERFDTLGGKEDITKLYKALYEYKTDGPEEIRQAVDKLEKHIDKKDLKLIRCLL